MKAEIPVFGKNVIAYTKEKVAARLPPFCIQQHAVTDLQWSASVEEEGFYKILPADRLTILT